MSWIDELEFEPASPWENVHDDEREAEWRIAKDHPACDRCAVLDTDGWPENLGVGYCPHRGKLMSLTWWGDCDGYEEARWIG